MIKDQDFQFKIVIVGNQGVGKSSIFLRFCDDHFADNYMPTIGVDFRFKTAEVQGKTCRLQIWDTAGQEKFRTITSAYYRSSQAVVIVYDRTDPSTFQQIQSYWLQQTRNNSDPNIAIVVAGNKSDMPSQVTDAEVNSLVEAMGVPAYSVSAKTGEGVEGMFRDICEGLIKTAEARRKEHLQLRGREEAPQRKGCCK